MDCSKCKEKFAISGKKIPLVIGCCGKSLCEECYQDLRLPLCPFCMKGISSKPPQNRELIAVLEGTPKVQIKEISDVKEALEAQESRFRTIDSVSKAEVEDAQGLTKQFVLDQGKYVVSVSNENTIHLSFVNCTLKVGGEEVKFDLRAVGGDLEKLYQVNIESGQAMLQVQVECMHVLKAMMNVQHVGSAKYGFSLRRVIG
eukprot:TRINITY_DN3424_c0_g1_i1.p1 TRINITY_DN3424_c0_g1~~TRINITY_DN3424_c0_g1_i1.p1  ORF type:complete len:201 (+),score=39.73 TRINITY_DN3424_c0_g1_i1:27-629(+)